jgi:hypothetical protein
MHYVASVAGCVASCIVKPGLCNKTQQRDLPSGAWNSSHVVPGGTAILFSSVQFCFTSVVGHVQPLDGASELRQCCGKVEAMPSGNEHSS